jgi:Flp pilus assembly protein CpaB
MPDSTTSPVAGPTTAQVPGAARLAALRRGVRRSVLRRRRLLAALLLGAAVVAGLRTVSPEPPPTVAVLAAARDLPAGTVLGPGDLASVPFAAGTSPAGTVPREELLGRTLAAPVRRGEPLTDRRVVGPGLLDGYPGLVAAPVPVPDPATAGLLRVGDRVDLLAADPRGGEATVLAEQAPVLALPDAPADQVGAAAGRVVVLAVPPDAAADIVSAGVQRYLGLVLSR